MGTYLSTPVLDKGEESGESVKCPISPLAWGVVDMQGWRKSMEDAHVACTNVEIPLHLDKEDKSHQTRHEGKVFGVFDGHGGPEVARFCQLYLVNVLTSMKTWKEDSPTEKDAVGQALIASFHALDRMIDDPERRDELIRLRTDKPSPGERRTAVLNLPADFFEEPKPPIIKDSPNNDCSNGSDLNNEIGPDPPPQEENAKEKQDPTEPTDSAAGETRDDDSIKVLGHDTMEHDDDDLMEEHGDGQEEPQPQEGMDSVASTKDPLLDQVLDIGGGDQLSISRNDTGQVEIQVTEEEEDGEYLDTNSRLHITLRFFSPIANTPFFCFVRRIRDHHIVVQRPLRVHANRDS